MANVEMNAITQHLRGSVGDLVFKRVRGTLRAVLRPKPTQTARTLAQLAVHRKFRSGAAYGKAVIQDAARTAFYAPFAASRKSSVFGVAMYDYLRPPVVEELILTGYQGRIGDKIGVSATDDVSVTDVTVRVLAEDGTVIEAGPAVKALVDWEYTATVAVPAGTNLTIEATATDRPGHTGTMTKPFVTV